MMVKSIRRVGSFGVDVGIMSASIWRHVHSSMGYQSALFYLNKDIAVDCRAVKISHSFVDHPVPTQFCRKKPFSLVPLFCEIYESSSYFTDQITGFLQLKFKTHLFGMFC